MTRKALFSRLRRSSRSRVSWAMCCVSARCGSTLAPRFWGARAGSQLGGLALAPPGAQRRRVHALAAHQRTDLAGLGAAVRGQRPPGCAACRRWRSVGAGRGQPPRSCRFPGQIGPPIRSPLHGLHGCLGFMVDCHTYLVAHRILGGRCIRSYWHGGRNGVQPPVRDRKSVV